MDLTGPAARAAYFGPRADRWNLDATGADHVTVKALDVVDGMIRQVLAIKATPKVYTGIAGDLEAFMASAWDETRPNVTATARELAELAATADADPRWKEKARRRLDKLQNELERAGADFTANPQEAATLGRYMAAAAALGKSEITTPMGWTAGFSLPDQDAIHGLTNAGTFWIGKAYGDQLDSAKLLAIVDKVAIQGGLGRVEAGDALAAAFGAEHDRSRTYWRGLAATVATRARSFGAVGAMAATGATVYEYVNPLDERTSDVCRRLDGQRFSVKGAVKLRDQLLATDNPDDWKAISPWPKLRDLEDPSGALLTPQDLQAKGIAWPPLHFHCRSSVDVVTWTPISHQELDPLGDVDATTPKPPPKPRPPKPVAAAAAAEPRHRVILHQRTAGPAGSNDGGFYTGTDGVARYVKFYKDPGQAAGEHVANRLYRDLGLGAPKSELFRTEDGRLAYASEIMDNLGTLEARARGATLAATKARAVKALDGFAADVLTANWDAAGLSMDNMVELPGGGIARIDQGAAFLHRAQGARKSPHHLADMSEWWKYGDGSNPGYARIMRDAGVDQAMEIQGLEDQIKAITALEKKAGGWGRYLAADTEITDSDRGAIVALLDDRTAKLEAKGKALAEIRRLNAADQKFGKYDAKTKAWGDKHLIPHRRMNAAEKAELRDYTGGAYDVINGDLRAGKAANAADKLRQSAIDGSTMPEDVVVWRGAEGGAWTQALLQGAAGEAEGRINLDPGFRSTSLAEDAASRFKGSRDSVMFKILIPKGGKGAWVEDFTQCPAEQEILLGMRSKIRVLTAKKTPAGYWLVQAVLEP